MLNISMLRAHLFTLASVSLAASLAVPAQASPQSEPSKYDPYDAPSDVRVLYKALEAGKQTAYQVDRGFRVTPSEPVLTKGILHAYDDGIIVLARVVDAEAEAVLLRVGARRIARADEISDNTLLEGRYYRVVPVAPSRDVCPDCGMEGPAPFQLEKRIGQEVVLQMALLENGRRIVVAVSDAR